MCASCHFHRPSIVEIGVEYEIVVVAIVYLRSGFAFWGTFKLFLILLTAHKRFNFDQSRKVKRKQRFNIQRQFQHSTACSCINLNIKFLKDFFF
jgi:hypothetical protein